MLYFKSDLFDLSVLKNMKKKTHLTLDKFCSI